MRWSTIPHRLRGCTAAVACSSVAALAQDGTAARTVSVKFQPMVGVTPFVCGTSYAGIGPSHTTITPSAFAFYVYDLRLLAADGTEVPLTLDQDGRYQNGTLALIDFADGTGPCGTGSATMHTEIHGTAPDRPYTGIRFVIGVPFERNHLELTTQPSPLSLTRMFWVWNIGHKFLRFDAKSTTGQNWLMHLGSTGCTPAGRPSTPPTSCAHENRVAVSFSAFNVDRDVIVADAAALFAGSGSARKHECMSAPQMPACAPMFAALGLPFNGSAPGSQTFLRPVATGVPERASGQ